MVGWLAVLAAIVAGVAVWLVVRDDAATASQPQDDPVAFLSGILRGVAANDYERVWPTLHPAQQRVATRSLYVRCERLSDPAAGAVVVTQTAHAVAVDGRWRWILSPERFATDRPGSCPNDVPPPGGA